MRISERGLDFIRLFEALDLESYPDPASALGIECTQRRLKLRDYRQLPNWRDLSGAPWTIGYGHTGPDVKQGIAISLDQAERYLEDDVLVAERALTAALTVEVNQRQFDALCSITFNVGVGGKNRSGIVRLSDADGGGHSTLLRKLNAHDFKGAAEQFLRWNRAGGVVMKGLVRRREAEKAMFEGGNGP